MAQIIVLNGVPRSGKTTIARSITELAPSWVNHGVDAEMAITAPERQPGIGLRPGDDRPEIRRLLPELYGRLWARVNEFADGGLNVVVDVGLYDAGLLEAARRRLAAGGHAVRWVEVRCSVAEVLRRRAATPGYVHGPIDATDTAPVRRWHDAVYGLDLAPDVVVDTERRAGAEIARSLLGLA